MTRPLSTTESPTFRLQDMSPSHSRPRCSCWTINSLLSTEFVSKSDFPATSFMLKPKKRSLERFIYCTLRFWSVMCTTSLHLSSATYIASAAANCSRGCTSVTYSWRSSFTHWVTLLVSTHTLLNPMLSKGSTLESSLSEVLLRTTPTTTVYWVVFKPRRALHIDSPSKVFEFLISTMTISWLLALKVSNTASRLLSKLKSYPSFSHADTKASLSASSFPNAKSTFAVYSWFVNENPPGVPTCVCEQFSLVRSRDPL